MSTPSRWRPLRYHPKQCALWRTKARFVAAACGRGSGKTELARRRVVRMLSVRRPWADPMFFYALPTREQAKRVAWNDLKALVPPEWVTSISESELVIRTIFGSSLHLVGMDKPQRIEGVQWDGGVLDESSDQKPGTYARSVRPALSHRDGWCWRIGVPKRFGCGAAEFRRFCEEQAEEYYNWPSEDILSPEEIASAREELDPRDYNEQYRATWEKVGGAVFYAFTEQLNVSVDVTYNRDLPLLVGSDFNVSPMCWVLGQERTVEGRKELWVFDEIVARDTNTPATLDELHRRYGKEHKSGFDFYGDATGKARKTSAATTDYLMIKNDKRFAGARVWYPDSNPPIVDRVAACNAMFMSAAGIRRCYVHPRCRRLIADMAERTWKENSREFDDSGDIGHASDAFGYIVHKRYPLRLDVSGQAAPQVGTTA